MRTVVVLVAVLVGGAGCSWMMVAGPPPAPGAVMVAAPPGSVRVDVGAVSPVGCTRQKFAPVVDTVFASMFAGGAAVTAPAGTALLFSSDDYNQLFGGMLVGASVVYALMATPFILSARTGYRDVAACRRAYERAFGSVYPPGT